MPRVAAVIDGKIVLSWGKMSQQMPLSLIFFSSIGGLRTIKMMFVSSEHLHPLKCYSSLCSLAAPYPSGSNQFVVHHFL